MRSSFLLALGLAALVGHAQPNDVGRSVYSSAQDSVFLIYLNDSSGTATALGSGFLVAPHILITNAHVVAAGQPVLAIGPARIPLKVVAVDKEDDLAELSVSADLTSKPLALAIETVKPGEQIFAIGNPEGLEKTISQGIVSGIRTRSGHDLIQITSPISHGSSGGPILNANGEVVGVAVGMLEDGQNLNFAVPIAYVKKLISRKAAPAAPFNLDENLRAEADLMDTWSNATYSNEPDSDYQAVLEKAVDGLRSIVENTNDPKALRQVACYGIKALAFSDLGIDAARKLAQAQSTAENQALLVYLLYDRAEDESFAAWAAQKDSNEEKSAESAHDLYLSEAAEAAERTTRSGNVNAPVLADYVQGKVKSEKGDYVSAIRFQEAVARVEYSVCDVDIAKNAMQGLIDSTVKAGRPTDAEHWFQAYAAKYEPQPYEWDAEGDRRSQADDQARAAQAYEKAAASPYYGYDYCYASVNRYFQTPANADAVLADGRACIDASTKNTDKDNEKHFNQELPFVYNSMAETLQTRGVYDAALDYAKQAINLKPDYSFAYYTEAEIYDALSRYPECIAAAQNAIRISDGKYAFMHFKLGNCYFSTENWPMAANSFRIAAEADKTDAASAFNLALSYKNEERNSDAQEWFHEALRRNPDSDLRGRILKLLQ